MKKTVFGIFAFWLAVFSVNNSFAIDRENIRNMFEEMGLFYLSDTLMDVTGDDTDDFVVRLFISANYPFHMEAVFPHVANDTAYYSFFNPTYCVEEKTVRCVYGSMVENIMLLEKYRWEGTRLDTLERYIVLTPHSGNPGFYREYMPIKKDDIPSDYFAAKRFDYFYSRICQDED